VAGSFTLCQENTHLLPPKLPPRVSNGSLVTTLEPKLNIRFNCLHFFCFVVHKKIMWIKSACSLEICYHTKFHDFKLSFDIMTPV
jgi:hypothetical protein